MRMVFAAALLGLAGLPAAAIAQDAGKGEAELAKLLEGRVAGKPVSCIRLPSVQSSTIVDGTAIVYRIGSRLYVNRPRGGARELDDDKILVTRTSGSQLCRVDTVNLHDRLSRFYAGFVQLGDFVPYERVKTGQR